jgi:hypothetical protein
MLGGERRNSGSEPEEWKCAERWRDLRIGRVFEINDEKLNSRWRLGYCVARKYLDWTCCKFISLNHSEGIDAIVHNHSCANSRTTLHEIHTPAQT